MNKVNLDAATEQNIMSHTLDVDKLFIDSPNLRPYFFKGGEMPSGKDYDKAAAIADYLLDFFDTFISQKKRWQSFKDDPESQSAWDNYMDNLFKRSPIMCKELKRTTDAKEYTTEFRDRFEKDCQNEFSGKP